MLTICIGAQAAAMFVNVTISLNKIVTSSNFSAKENIQSGKSVDLEYISWRLFS